MTKSESLPAQIKRNPEGPLALNQIIVDADYAQKWNADAKDFVLLTKGGEVLRNTLYRVGGLNFNLKVGIDKYFLLLKYSEDIYDTDFIKRCYPNKSSKDQESARKHLKYQWVIIDFNGNEKVEFPQFASPYLVKDSCVYSLDRKYYNIETKELYCYSHDSLESRDFLFLNNAFDDDKSKRGVMKINKISGSFELFPEK